MTKKRALAYLAFILLAVFALTSQRSFCEETSPQTLMLTVYPDGFTFVDYSVGVDKTFPTQNITVFGQIIEDLIVVDANELPLSYQLDGSLLSVHSLGTEQVGVTYQTQDLTSKDGRYWTLAFDAPISSHITLPQETVIISLNKVPELIETQSDQVTLVMDSGAIEVTYVIGVVGTQEHAQIVINEAENTITEIQNLEINVTEAETKLQDAQTSFGHGNYPEAEAFANEAQNLAILINQTANQAKSKIAEAQTAVTNAQNDKRTFGLMDAQDLLDEANSNYELGNYSEALSLATQAILEAQESTLSTPEEAEGFPVYGVVAAIAVPAVIILVFVLVRSRKKPEVAEKPKRQIDIERIFREHTDLMPEEKQAIQYLADNNGEAFEAELYDHVKLPRTTTWRLVKRLRRMEIITVTKFRRQNLVRLKTKYDIKE